MHNFLVTESGEPFQAERRRRAWCAQLHAALDGPATNTTAVRRALSRTTCALCRPPSGCPAVQGFQQVPNTDSVTADLLTPYKVLLGASRGRLQLHLLSEFLDAPHLAVVSNGQWLGMAHVPVFICSLRSIYLLMRRGD